jgi:hypothetical protein
VQVIAGAIALRHRWVDAGKTRPFPVQRAATSNPGP